MKDTFEFSGDYEWAVWHKDVVCAVCRMNEISDSTQAVGVMIEVFGPDSSVSPDTIEVTPVCEECGDENTIRFIKEDN